MTNSVDPLNQVTGLFSNTDLTIHLSFIAKSPHIFMRNFELHQVVRRIELNSLPLQMGTTANSMFMIVLQQDNVLKMIDMVNSENTSEIRTTHEQASCMKICPNGRYVLTGGARGDVCLWSINKREVKPEDIAQLMQ